MTLPPHLTLALQRFQAASAQPEACQQRILHHILHTHAASDFGRRHDFAAIRDYKDFTQQVPLRRYEDFLPDIQALAAGQPAVLGCEALVRFEETGGSSGGAKLIPYTPSLLAAFRRAVLPWLADLLQQRPQAVAGKLFFVISPPTRHQPQTAGGIAIGNGDDLTYFDAATAAWLQPRTLFPPELMRAQTAADWQWQCALLLLNTPDLSLISLWSPTLLLGVLDTMQQQADSLLSSLPPSRRATVARALAHHPIDTQALWPQLAIVSAWDSHTAAAPAVTLRQQLPHAHLQGKGLLATEAVSSIPLTDSRWPVLACDSHFYEFADAAGNLHLPQHLKTGEAYRLIVTTQGGLYRYDTGDWVLMHGRHQRLPQLEFIGRDSLVSDLCGEKLTEAFVRQAMQQVDSRLPHTALLQACHKPAPHYCLLLPATQTHRHDWANQLDLALAANPQYRLCRSLGQLDCIRIRAVDDLLAYAAGHHHASQRLSTRKIPLLLPPCVE